MQQFDDKQWKFWEGTCQILSWLFSLLDFKIHIYILQAAKICFILTFR